MSDKRFGESPIKAEVLEKFNQAILACERIPVDELVERDIISREGWREITRSCQPWFTGQPWVWDIRGLQKPTLDFSDCFDAERGYYSDSTLLRTSRPHYFSFLGQALAERELGVPFDRTRRIDGDGGIDFTLPDGRTVDVKTVATAILCGGSQNTEKFSNPHLKEKSGRPAADYPDLFQLVHCDTSIGIGGLVGYATAEQMLNARCRNYSVKGEERGVQRYIPADKLFSLGQSGRPETEEVAT
jgi:hypothetical protein